MSILKFPIAIHQASCARVFRERRLTNAWSNAWRWRIGLIQPRNTVPARSSALIAARPTTERIKAYL